MKNLSISRLVAKYLSLVKVICLICFLVSHVSAQTIKNYQVEGHVFSASTLRPLPGVKTELWEFLRDGSQTYIAWTDEGGFYVIEYPPSIAEQNGLQDVQGYAFAFICEYRNQRKVQIVPLYSSIERGKVYKRNVYLNVPKTVLKCDQPQ